MNRTILSVFLVFGFSVCISASHAYSPYNDADVQWQIQSHEYRMDYHEYKFRGQWQRRMDNGNPWLTFTLNVTAKFYPFQKTFEEVCLISSPYNPSFTSVIKGEVTFDPWLQVNLAMPNLAISGTAYSADAQVFTFSFPAAPISRHAISREYRMTLIQEAALAPPTFCERARKAPIVISPGNSDRYSGKVLLSFEVNCAFSLPYGGKHWFEAEILTPNPGTTDMVDGAYFNDFPTFPVIVNMHLTPNEYHSYGTRELVFNTGGEYRLRARTRFTYITKIDNRELEHQEVSEWSDPVIFNILKISKEIVSSSQVLVAPDSADLAFDGFAADEIKAGERDLGNVITDYPRYYMVWTVRNKGKKHSSYTRVEISCEKIGGGTCPPELSGNLNIPVLWPAPADASVHKTWLPHPVAEPSDGGQYRLKAVIDPEGTSGESGLSKGNNEMVSVFPGIRSSIKKTGLQQIGTTPKPITPQKIKGQAGALQKGTDATPVTARPGPAVIEKKTLVSPEPAAVSPPADIVVTLLRTNPVRPVVGKQFEIHFDLMNKGGLPSGNGLKYKLACSPQGKSTPCPIPAGPYTIGKAIAPKGSLHVMKTAIIKTAGDYQITVTPIPGTEKGSGILKMSVDPDEKSPSTVAPAVKKPKSLKIIKK